MNEVTTGPLRDVGEGTRILTPAGPLPTIVEVEWEDPEGEVTTVWFDDGTSASGPGDQIVRSAWARDVSGDLPVAPDDLAAAPTPTWTVAPGESPADRHLSALRAHLAGDSGTVLARTAFAEEVEFTGNHNHWSPVEAALALRAWTLHRSGDEGGAAATAARLEVEGFRPEHAARAREALHRHLTAPLSDDAEVRLGQVLLRWARGGTDGFPRSFLAEEHDRTLAALIAELAE